jgi:hypothetical protein
MSRDTLTVYYIELLNSKGSSILDTKLCFDSVIRAIGRARMMKREHQAARARVENGDTGKIYWI